jgi:hypothetical protein
MVYHTDVDMRPGARRGAPGIVIATKRHNGVRFAANICRTRRLREHVQGNGRKSMQASPNKNKPVRERLDLDRRYGDIGISAVAAALRYCSDGKNPAYAPVAPQLRDEHEDVAA